MSQSSTVVPGHRRRMESGTLSPWIQKFADHLRILGYTGLTIRLYSGSVRHFAHWLGETSMALPDVDEGLVKQFACHTCQCPGSRHASLSGKYSNRVRRFVGFLAEHGIVRATASRIPEAADRRQVVEFQQWLRLHRGVSEGTIHQRGRLLMKLLPALGGDPAAYDAKLIRRVILGESRKHSRAHVKSIATALRSYLRYLAARGECRPWLDQAVPAIAQWRLSALPRYLPASDIERVIASCDLTKQQGIRDRAILLLLARLGLRGGDVVAMRLDDITWEEGTLRVRGKGRRESRLPLPQDVGDAVLNYLATARPVVDCDRVFLRSAAPCRPFAGSAAISCVVRSALRRAGINSPTQGANLFRHSIATAMLRAGVTLDTIGTVLRHQSINTTAHYAKVDIVALCQIAQPWPREEVTC